MLNNQFNYEHEAGMNSFVNVVMEILVLPDSPGFLNKLFHKHLSPMRPLGKSAFHALGSVNLTDIHTQNCLGKDDTNA